MVLDNLFLLQLPPLLAIGLISLFITFLVTIIYKFTTNQKRMKHLKEEQKRLQKEYKKNLSNSKKAMEINKKLMSTNMEYMKHSFKSTLYTFLPLILIFSWMNSHFGYEQINPGEKFQVIAEFKEAAEGTITLQIPDGLQFVATNATQPVAETVSWKLRGAPGTHVINYTHKDEFYQQRLLITNEWKYLDHEESGEKLGDVEKVKINLESVRPFKGVPLLGGLNWLWSYIIISIISSIMFRKLLKVY